MTEVKPTLTLYTAEICPFGFRAWFAIELKKLDYSIEWFDVKNKSKLFKEVYSKSLGKDPNSAGQVPIIKHNNIYLTQSEVVCRYLDNISPNTPLFPKDPMQKAKVEFMTQIGKKIVPVLLKFYYGKDKWKNIHNNTKELKAFLKTINENLLEYSESDEKPFLCGKQVSLFEVTLFPLVIRVTVLYEFFESKVNDLKWEELLKGNDRLKVWYNALTQHPCVQKIYDVIKRRTNMKAKHYWLSWYNKNNRDW